MIKTQMFTCGPTKQYIIADILRALKWRVNKALVTDMVSFHYHTAIKCVHLHWCYYYEFFRQFLITEIVEYINRGGAVYYCYNNDGSGANYRPTTRQSRHNKRDQIYRWDHQGLLLNQIT